jgi:glycosyltransferase involved in cell wall biosynthesis
MTTKATRAKIKLGDIDLDVFQLPDGSYGYTYEWLGSLIDRDKSILSDKKSPFYLYSLNKSLSKEALTNQRVSVEGISKAKLNYLTEPQLMVVLGSLAHMVPEKVVPLLVACGIEALERRADAAFGVIRDEEERNELMAARVKGKVARRSLTDVIKAYIESHEVSDNYKKFIFSNCSDHLNKIILGAKAKQARDFYQIPESSLLRNHVPVAALRELELTEEMAARLIEERDMEPLEAVKQACVVCFTRSVGLS